MSKFFVVSALFIFFYLSCSTFTDKTTIDAFFVADAGVITQNGTGVKNQHTAGEFIVGSERDSYIVVNNGSISAGVSGNKWLVGFAGSGQAYLQYDGFDFVVNDDLDRFGLEGYNFGLNDANCFHFQLETTAAITLRAIVYYGDESAVWETQVPAGGVQNFYPNFEDDFIGNVDLFYSAGALEIYLIGNSGASVTFSRPATALDDGLIEVDDYDTNSITTATNFTFVFQPYGSRYSFPTSSGTTVSIYALFIVLTLFILF